jgi:hypothetical protein
MSSSFYRPILVRLLDSVPEFEEYYWHLHDQSCGVLPYWLMSALEGFTRELAQELFHPTGRFSDPGNVLSKVLAFVEEGLQNKEQEIHDLLAAGFIEHMDPRDPTYPFIRSQMGLASQHALELLGSDWKTSKGSYKI